MNAPLDRVVYLGDRNSYLSETTIGNVPRNQAFAASCPPPPPLLSRLPYLVSEDVLTFTRQTSSECSSRTIGDRSLGLSVEAARTIHFTTHILGFCVLAGC